MNFPVVILALALAVFTGSQASRPKNESAPRLPKSTEEWEQELIQVFGPVGEQLGILWDSDFAKELRNLLNSLASNVTDTWNQHDWPEDLREECNLFFGASNQIREKAKNAVIGLAIRLGAPSEKLLDSALEVLAVYVDPILDPVTPDVESILSGLVARTQALLLKVIETRESIQSYGDRLAPYVKELREYVESIHPTVTQAEEKIILVVEAFYKHLWNPYISPIVKESEKYTPDFRAWASARGFPPHCQKQ